MSDTDFISQLVSQLQASAALLAAVGETATKAKIFSDVAEGSPDPPYIVLTEDSETPNFQGPDGDGIAWHFNRGTVTAHVFAPGKSQARRIGELVATQLNDAPIVPSDGILLELRRSGAAFKAIGDTAPGVSTLSYRLIQFTYMIQRQG